jgi:hypothetical protein
MLLALKSRPQSPFVGPDEAPADESGAAERAIGRASNSAEKRRGRFRFIIAPFATRMH